MYFERFDLIEVNFIIQINTILPYRFSLIKVLGFILFIALVHGITFDCQFYDGVWVIAGSVYTCKASIKELSGTALTNLSGNHINSKSNFDVEALNIIDQNLAFIPKNIDEFFSNVKVLELRNTSLSLIFRDDLKQFANLQVLRLTDNKLTSLKSDLFQSNSKLQYISFAGNSIAFVDKNLLTSLTALKSADFRNNRCIDSFANTQQSIKMLNQLLETNCQTLQPSTPAVATTTIASVTIDQYNTQCNNVCLEQIEKQKNENDEKFEKVYKEMMELKDHIFSIANIEGNYEERIDALEKWMKSLNRCVSCDVKLKTESTKPAAEFYPNIS